MKRKVIIVVLVFVLVTMGAFAAWWLQEQENDNGRLTLYGHVDIRDVKLAFIEQEIVSDVLVDEGDKVVPGQIVAKLRSDRLESQLAEAKALAAATAQVVKRLVTGTREQEIKQAKAAVAEARVKVRNARLNLRRVEKTAPFGASSKQALDDSKTQLEVDEAQLKVREETLNLALEGPREEDIAEAKARLAANQAQVAFLEKRLKDTRLIVPTAGVVQSRILEPGDVAGPSQPALVVAITDPKWIRAYVPEPDLGRIDRGQRAEILSDSWPESTFSGHIGFISPVAEFTPKVVETTDLRTKLVYEVRVWVEDPENRLRLGMPVTVLIDVEHGTKKHD